MRFTRQRIVYHAPCDLGRGSGVFDEPKAVLKHVALLEKSNFEDENSLCCGGSLGNLKISSQKRRKIASDTVTLLTGNNPDLLATSCPLCKKTFAQVSKVRVADISEIVAETLQKPVLRKSRTKEFFSIKELVDIS
jgi:Fe-S oxidoreductase